MRIMLDTNILISAILFRSEKFLTALSFELEYSPDNYDGIRLFEIRDIKDYMVLYTAILSEVDVLITGDKDFMNLEIERPEILTPSEFLEKY